MIKMKIEELPGRLTEYDWENKHIPVYELSPEEVQELRNQGLVFIWEDKEPHNGGEPRRRLYSYVGLTPKGKLPLGLMLRRY